MAYTVLARKYRPQTFSDLVGQEHVTRTLGNAIASGRVAHAFLFTGVRGVGKTSSARILAKALNCASPTGGASGPTSEPCGVCDPCREITIGMDLDVLEIDGASNNSVEDVRRLQETIPFRPARDRFKIVIVDEVHMLSTGAFNAFLKTLEEPPPHVKFIFATTESHKVPITIRSRCQRYDFRLIPQNIVAARVREILVHEGIEADDAAVAIVARESAGSMRDALTLLDQIVAFAGAKLEGEEVARVLGLADRDLLHRAAASVLEGDGAAALVVVDALATRGLDMLHFSRALTELMRDLVVLKVAGEGTDLVALVDEERRRATELVSRVEELELQRAFASFSLLVDEIAKASMPRLTLEMGLVRLATRPPLRAIAEVVARLDALQRRGPGGPAPSGPRGGGGGGGRGGPPRPQPASASSDDASALIDKLRNPGGARSEQSQARQPAQAFADVAHDTFAPPADVAPSWSAPQHAAPQPAASHTAAPQPAASHVPQAAAAQPPAASFAAPPAPAFGPPVLAAVPSRGSAPPPSRGSAPPPPSHRPQSAASLASASALASATALAHALAQQAPESISEPDPATTSVSVRAPAAAARSARITESDATARWETVVAVLMETKPALGAVLLHATPTRIGGSELVLAFPAGSFYRRQADAPEAKSAIAEIAERVLGIRPTVEIVERAAGADDGPTIAELETERTRARWEATKKKALNHPMVVEALSIFEARPELAEVRLEGD